MNIKIRTRTFHNYSFSSSFQSLTSAECRKFNFSKCFTEDDFLASRLHPAVFCSPREQRTWVGWVTLWRTTSHWTGKTGYTLAGSFMQKYARKKCADEHTGFVSVCGHKVQFGQSYYSHSGPLVFIMLWLGKHSAQKARTVLSSLLSWGVRRVS